MIQREAGETARALVSGLELRLPHRDQPAGAGELAVRPQAIRLRAGTPQAGEIGGTVNKAAYLGSHMEYEILLDGIGAEVFVIAGGVAAPHTPGERVAVSIEASGAALIPTGKAIDDRS